MRGEGDSWVSVTKASRHEGYRASLRTDNELVCACACVELVFVYHTNVEWGTVPKGESPFRRWGSVNTQ